MLQPDGEAPRMRYCFTIEVKENSTVIGEV